MAPGAADRLDQHLDRLPDLATEALGDLFLLLEPSTEQRRQGLNIRHTEETATFEEAAEGGQGLPLL